MSLRYIDNVSILADVGERVTLPSTLIARQNTGSLVTVSVTWTPRTVDTSTEGEFIFEGVVSGYAHKVLCSVQVGRMEDNPQSSFPERIDEFGLPKKDIQTADITDIDDYQYFKAKVPRTVVEDMQLKQLKELLADKIILARDINHMRNAIVKIEECCLNLQDSVSDLEDKLRNLERRVTTLEDETIIDGANVGRGAELFYRKNNRLRELEFRTLVGRGQTNVYEDGREIVIDVNAPVGCGFDVKGDSFETCLKGGNFPFKAMTDVFGFSGYMNCQMVELKSGHYTMLWVFGQGTTGDFNGCARFMKGEENFIIEMKHGSKYSGLEINSRGLNPYNGEDDSRINGELKNVDVWSSDVRMPR